MQHAREQEPPAKVEGPAFTPPAEFEEYRLIRPIGQGAMGQVYLAHDTLLDRPVAIKFMAIAPEGGARERFFTEARAVARLSHPNVVAVHRVGEVRRRPYLVSELVRGVALSELQRPLRSGDLLPIALGLARGLGAAHRRGVLHRDIKPGNAMITEDGQVKLLDFGLAKLDAPAPDAAAAPGRGAQPRGPEGPAAPAEEPLSAAVAQAQTLPIDRGAGLTTAGLAATAAAGLDSIRAATAGPATAGLAATAAAGLGATASAAQLLQAPTLGTTDPGDSEPPAGGVTAAGAWVGTPLYMPPEAWRGEPATPEGDVYSLGALLYELGAGRPPFGAATLGALREAVLAGPPPPLAALAPGLDGALAALIDRCLRPAPAERFRGGDALCEALEALSASARAALPEGNPYRGLLAFEAEHRDLFFGRGAEVRDVLDRLRAGPFVLVCGDSGVGKSSLCRAGVLPLAAEGALGPGCALARLVPGRRPLQALAQALAPLLGDEEGAVAERLRAAPQELAAALRRRLGGPGAASGPPASAPGGRLLLFVDQMEELATLAPEDEARAADAALGALAGLGAAVRILGTVRSDFLVRLSALPFLGAEIGAALYLLRPLSRAGVEAAITGPAARKGFAFETPALVRSLGEAAQGEGGLPLLQFALAELWEARDGARRLIPEAALAALGGVAGALARHADGVLRHLLPAQRAAARRLLLRLVTAEGTRARRAEAELCGRPPERDALAALAALVKGRLLLVRSAEDEGGDGAYEIAHEALLSGWGTLRGWLNQSEEARSVRQRLERSAAEWERLGRLRAALWHERQLGEAAILDEAELGAGERAFLGAARAAARRGRRRRAAAVIGAPLLLLCAVGGNRLSARLELDRAVAAQGSAAEAALAAGRAAAAEARALRQGAYARFDAGDRDGGEAAWERALHRGAAARRGLGAAAEALEAALLLDSARGSVRARLAEVEGERALLAEGESRLGERDEHLGRRRLYAGAAVPAEEPAALSLRGPAGGAVTLQRYEAREDGRRVVGPPRRLALPQAELPLPPGSYLLSAEAPGRAALRYPLLLGRGERRTVSLEAPRQTAVPPGMIYVAPGRFLFGAAGDDGLRRDFYYAAPLHAVQTGAYLIARDETTWADWIGYLEALPEAERARRTPRGANFEGLGVELRRGPGGAWQLSMQPKGQVYRARAGEPLRYEGRDRRQQQDWLRLPVSAVSFEDAQAYAAWLRRSGRLPGARLCTEVEWERAARGADDREFPHGDRLDPDDANFDLTYGRAPSAVGPDEVGSHPASDSPFGLRDAAGNIFEWTRSSLTPGDAVVRGACFFYQRNMVRLYNREVINPQTRTQMIGLRLCADAPPPG